MRKILALIIVSLWVASCSGPQQKNGWQKYELSGKVKKLTQKAYLAVVKDGKITKGLRQEHEAPGANKDLVLTFDDKGNLLEEKTISFQDSLISKGVFEYDGHKTKETWYNAKGEPYLTIKYQYSFGGTPESAEHYNTENKLTAKQTYEYKDGHKISETWYDAEGNVESTWNYTYNNEGKLANETWTKANGQTNYDRTLRYGPIGKLSAQTWYLGQGPDSEWLYEYDGQGNLVKITAQFSDGSTTAQAYQLDKKGNWIQAVLYKNQQPISVIERSIEYFK